MDVDGLMDALIDDEIDELIDDEIDGLMDELIDDEIDGLIDDEIDDEIDGDSDSDGLASETANVPDEVKVCMVLLPLVDMLPPVAVMSPVV